MGYAAACGPRAVVATASPTTEAARFEPVNVRPAPAPETATAAARFDQVHVRPALAPETATAAARFDQVHVRPAPAPETATAAARFDQVDVRPAPALQTAQMAPSAAQLDQVKVHPSSTTQLAPATARFDQVHVSPQPEALHIYAVTSAPATSGQLEQVSRISLSQAKLDEASIQQDSNLQLETCYLELRQVQNETLQLKQEQTEYNNNITECHSKRTYQDQMFANCTEQREAEVAKFQGCAETLKDRLALHASAEQNAAAEKRLRVNCSSVLDLTRLELSLANSNLSNVNNLLKIRNGDVQKFTNDLDVCQKQEAFERARRNAKETELGVCKSDKLKVDGELRIVKLNLKTLNTTSSYCCSVKTELNFTLRETRTELTTCQNALEQAREDSRQLVVTRKDLKAAEHLSNTYKEASLACDSARLTCNRELFGNQSVLRSCQQDYANLTDRYLTLSQNLTVALDDLSMAETSLDESSRMLRVCEEQRDTMKIRKDNAQIQLDQCKKDILCECSQMSDLQSRLEAALLAKETAEIASSSLKDQLLECGSTKDKINIDKHNLTISLAGLAVKEGKSISTTDKDRTTQIWMAMTFVFFLLFWVVSIVSCFLAYDKRQLYRERAELVAKIQLLSHESHELSLALIPPPVAAATLPRVRPRIPFGSSRTSAESLI